MGYSPITYQSKPISVHKAIAEPDFTSKTVLVSDTWEYVSMWLKRKGMTDAIFYWQQAKHFFDAAERLPNISAPLTAYYCFLNAAKSLLRAKKKAFSNIHGVDGETVGRRTSLSNEQVEFKTNGVLSELCRYLGEIANREKYNLKDLLYNLPYIHRAYKLTYSSRPELFIPISPGIFVRKHRSTQSWFCAEIKETRYANAHTLNKLPNIFERDEGVKDKFIIRERRRFNWEYRRIHLKENLRRLRNYHHRIRKHLYYIYGPTRLWYIKRSGNVDGLISRSSLSITFAAMHRLSELARYNPVILSKHLECHHNWLLSEFISTALYQFIDEISSEITGQEFMIPGRTIRE